MKTIYLINLSFGIAGIERRFLNIWNTLKLRRNVKPILVIPDTLAKLFNDAGLINIDDDLLWLVKEDQWSKKLSKVNFSSDIGSSIIAILRSRDVAINYNYAWGKIVKDKNAVLHIGMKCSGLIPPNIPTVYECVDSLLISLKTKHFSRAAKKYCIVNCQTDRIKKALDAVYLNKAPKWITETSPIYFADYNNLDKYEITRDPTLIAFVGRFSHIKNPLLFVDVIKFLRMKEINVHAIMLGEGPLLNSIKRKIDQYKLNEVISIDFSHDPKRLLKEAAIYVSLQNGDNYGSQALLEAMAAGCAIVATDVGETRRIITSNVGLLVNHSVDQIGTAIQDLIINPSIRNILGNNAAKIAKTEYTANKYAEYLESLYEKAFIVFNRK